MRSLILLILFVAVTDVYAASSSAVTTATTSAATTAAMYHVMHSNRMAAEHGISKAFRNETISRSDSDIVVPCEVYWISEGIFKTDLRVDVEKTLRKCDKEKSVIEQLNNVKYSFGKAKTYDPYFGKVYLELIQND